MTREEIMKLTGRGLELAVGRKVMGITPHLWEGASLVNALDRASQDTPRYTTDANALRDMEQEIARRGLGVVYISHLVRFVYDYRYEYCPVCDGAESITYFADEVFSLKSAPMESCCRAALIVVEGMEKS